MNSGGGDAWWLALGLVLVFEGLLPLLSPGGWRRVFTQMLSLRDGQIRFFGLISVAAGLLIAGLFA
ncbi:DUF2065 domain-containing protein [Hydrogenophaga sp. YM1]|jgi:uncharacterized protein YjeT (DUF2065 family)|uniref:DUF2065 domain-containing protein n=1 Tax=Hydrogenophaga TaxID=47420 RepID=UPI00086F8C9E|nr:MULTISPECIES: DUF2065 domain-containing protein [unclassified Hydrogenophaga]MBN9371654.1 DUF2065 domain-containing protein [Hydrogenophaga sp.]ODT33172.1 MAG: DUF2065 domain-containing protein [Hydrogenophaga sp. SCN 70-13]OJV48150.1 MAG: DUF2065 domain-containing protein [Hydrogenophaga sp. 70-12]QRR32688.1 DUF2065 domain-containing protein [Hydrogenophaga sp. YM1]